MTLAKPAHLGEVKASILRFVRILTVTTAVIGLLPGMTLLLCAGQGLVIGIFASLSATAPVIIRVIIPVITLPVLWLRTGQRPSLLR